MTAQFEQRFFFKTRYEKVGPTKQDLYVYKEAEKTLYSYFINLKIFLLIKYSVFFKT